MTTIINAILAINPDAQVCVTGDGVDKITWENGTPAISNEDILAKQAELKTAYDAKQYQRDRAEEYPTWQDQLDDIYHNGIDAWKATIKATKDKYPKS
jgi:phosphosulfolactate synthase (CoM biosynthesis protein A)